MIASLRKQWLLVVHAAKGKKASKVHIVAIVRRSYSSP